MQAQNLLPLRPAPWARDTFNPIGTFSRWVTMQYVVALIQTVETYTGRPAKVPSPGQSAQNIIALSEVYNE